MLNIDNLFTKERNKTLELMNTGKVFNLGFKEINQMDEIIYGSATVESTYTFTSDLFSKLQDGYSMKLKDLEKLDQGCYEPPVVRTAEDIASAWANF